MAAIENHPEDIEYPESNHPPSANGHTGNPDNQDGLDIIEEEVPSLIGGYHIGCIATNMNSAVTWTQQPLSDKNWAVWHKRMTYVFRVCCIQGYVMGWIACPDPTEDPKGADIWVFNDDYAKLLITNNIGEDKMIHIDHCEYSAEMWKCLEAIHESHGHQMTTAYIHNLWHTITAKGNDIPEHLGKLRKYYQNVNCIADEDFKLSNKLFKVTISSSLPASWDTFTEPYVGGRAGAINKDPNNRITSQELIGLLKEEYI